jgi:hypothetical protein
MARSDGDGMPFPLNRADAAYLGLLFAFAALAAGIGVAEIAAGATGVLVGVWLLASRRPPFANERIPTASSVVAGASAGALWRRRRAAKRRGLA